MAGDPELLRFGGPIARLHEDGQSGTVPPMRGAHISFPSQHLREVLHFVCELRGSRVARACSLPWTPAFAGVTEEKTSLHNPYAIAPLWGRGQDMAPLD